MLLANRLLSFVFGDAPSAQVSTTYQGRHVGETTALLRITAVATVLDCQPGDILSFTAAGDLG